MKKYSVLRICEECDEQKMVNSDGYCSACVKKNKEMTTAEILNKSVEKMKNVRTAKANFEEYE